MTTRLYFPGTAAAAVSPAFDAGWNFTAEAVRRRLILPSQRLDGAINTGVRVGPWTANTTTYALDRQYVSDPLLGNQTIGGTFKGMLQVSEWASDDNVDQLWVSIRVVSNDGATVRGTLAAHGFYGIASEFSNTSWSNRWLADNDALTSVNALDGDRIVVEIGYRASGAAGTPVTPEASGRWGARADVGDLAEGQSNPGAQNLSPWIEFSQTLTFHPGAARVEVAFAEVPRIIPFVAGVVRMETLFVEVFRSLANPLPTGPARRSRILGIRID